jgi:CRP/FNR family transcriptional regulator, cyclic AMP receptor protein
MNRQDILAKLKNISLFESIRDKDGAMEKLLEIVDFKLFKKEETLIKEGTTADDEMFILHKGSVEIKKLTRSGDMYTVAKLKAEQNIFFGELALIDDDKRSATVITCEDSEFITISKKAFVELGNNHPEIGLPITRAISKNLSARLRKTTEDMLTIFDALVNEINN